jgi:hypothetical protein
MKAMQGVVAVLALGQVAPNTSRYSRSARQNTWAKQRLDRLGPQQEQQ